MHTDTTLSLFSQVTTSFGNSLRTFKEKTCKVYTTRELEREHAGRMRRQAKGKTSMHQKHKSGARQPKQLNLKTYKFHALGDYVQTIRQFGTTDSYSTQSVSSSWRCVCLFDSYEDYQSEREHRTSKARFLRTSGRSIPKQLSGIERRQRRVRTIRQNLDGGHSQIEQEPIVANDPGIQYEMGGSENFPVHVPTFLQRNQGDPAIQVNNLFPSIEPC